jgi:hypothetical protein
MAISANELARNESWVGPEHQRANPGPNAILRPHA